MENQKQKFDFETFVRIVALAKPHRWVFITALSLSIIIALISPIRPYLINVMVNDYISSSVVRISSTANITETRLIDDLKDLNVQVSTDEQGVLTITGVQEGEKGELFEKLNGVAYEVVTGDLDGLKKLTFIFIGVILMTVLIRYLFIYRTALIGQLVIKDLRVKVFNHITNLRLRFFDQTPIGKLTTRTTNDIEAINTSFTNGLVTMVADILTIFSVIGIMLFTSWRLTLLSLGTLPLLMIATYIFKEKVKAAFQIVRTQVSTMNAFLQERITGMRIIQIFNAEKNEMEKFKTINRKYTQANLDAILYYAVFFPVVEIINYLTLALMVWIGSKWFLNDQVTLGAMIAFPIYISMMFRPVRMLADKFNTLQMGMVAAERVFNVLDTKDYIPDNGYLEPEKLNGSIEFENVDFAYDEENKVIKSLDFKLEPGETLAIVGSTGSGKTTIINILNRFYDIQGGRILIDGEDIGKYKLEDLRSRMSMVLQDVFLFTGSVMENITLKDNSYTVEQVKEAAKIIGAHEFFEKLPGAYDFLVMERGANLSMGQRQLISFVRALLYDPDILILDEATSSIDTETESIIQYAIEKLIEKRTSIIIAHRLSTIKHAHKILVMEHGEKIELGSHAELLQNEDGKYRELYEMQFSSEEQEVA